MRTRAILAVFLTGLVALVSTVLIARQGDAVPVKQTETKPKPKAPKRASGHPEIAPKGPYPKFVADEADFDFGVMLFGTRKTHTFVIRNEGTVPLEIRNGGTTCTCTVGKLAQKSIPPGGSAKVEVSWKPFAPAPNFKQSAIIWTNDPKHQKPRLSVKGSIEQIVSVVPKRAWAVGLIAGDKPITVTGKIYSRLLNEFKVLKVHSNNRHVKTQAVKFTKKELALLKAKSGWTIKATILPEIRVGRLNAQLTIQTDIENKTPQTGTPKVGALKKPSQADLQGMVSYKLNITGYRPGPIRIVPTPGSVWDARSSTVGLGSFRHEEGRTCKLYVYIGGLKGKPFQILNTQSDLPFLKVSLDTKTVVNIGSEQRYLLTFKIPPGQPRMSRIGSDPVKVVLKTNHPKLRFIRLKVKFVSL